MDLKFWGILFSILVFVVITEGFDHFLLIYLQRIGGNIYWNGIICGFIQFFAYIVTYYLDDVRRMILYRVVTTAIIICSSFFLIAHYYLWDKIPYYDHISIAIIGIMFFFTSIGQSIIFVYPIEVYPTSTRMIGISLICLLMHFFIPTLFWIASYLEEIGLNPVLSTLPYTLVGFVLTFFLPETLNKKMEWIIIDSFDFT